MNGPRDLARPVAISGLGCTAVAAAAHFLQTDQGAINAIKVVSASLTVLIVPGLLVILIARTASTLTLLESVGLGAALSIGIATLLTVLAMVSRAPLALPAA